MAEWQPNPLFSGFLLFWSLKNHYPSRLPLPQLLPTSSGFRVSVEASLCHSGVGAPALPVIHILTYHPLLSPPPGPHSGPLPWPGLNPTPTGRFAPSPTCPASLQPLTLALSAPVLQPSPGDLLCTLSGHPVQPSPPGPRLGSLLMSVLRLPSSPAARALPLGVPGPPKPTRSQGDAFFPSPRGPWWLWMAWPPPSSCPGPLQALGATRHSCPSCSAMMFPLPHPGLPGRSRQSPTGLPAPSLA